jgi:hypothetical protein
MRHGTMQTILAVDVGLILSLGGGPLLPAILYKLSPINLLAFVSATLMLVAAALVACFFSGERVGLPVILKSF